MLPQQLLMLQAAADALHDANLADTLGPRAGIFVGLLALAFGLTSPVFVKLMLATPKAFIAALAGLAMLRVLQTAFTISFKERFALGALVTFLVTVADVPIFNIGAPFWGLVFGFAASWLLERGDFAAQAKG